MNDVFDVLHSRTKRIEGFSYKLHTGGYGLDVVIPDDVDVDESKMSVVVPFADGNRRDGVGDLLEVGGINTERHRKNPICLFDHAKQTVLPVGLSENPGNNHYTVNIDPVNKSASAKVFFYQGKSDFGVDKNDEYDHAVFCEQLFDLIAKRYVRGGSIGYQVSAGVELPPDYQRGIPKGLHLLSVNMLEMSIVVMPANQDTVRKALSLNKVCGKPLSPMLVKSLTPYAPPKKATLFKAHESRLNLAGVNQAPGHESEEIDNDTEYREDIRENRRARDGKEDSEGPLSDVRPRDPKRKKPRNQSEFRLHKNVKATPHEELVDLEGENQAPGREGQTINNSRERYQQRAGWSAEEAGEEIKHPPADVRPRDPKRKRSPKDPNEFRLHKDLKAIRNIYKVKATRDSRGPDRDKLNQAQTRAHQDLQEWHRGDQDMEDIADPAIEIDPDTEQSSHSGDKDIKSNYFQDCPRDETGHCLPKGDSDKRNSGDASHVRQGSKNPSSPKILEFGVFSSSTHSRNRKDALRVFTDKHGASEYANKHKSEHEEGLIVARIGGEKCVEMGEINTKARGGSRDTADTRKYEHPEHNKWSQGDQDFLAIDAAMPRDDEHIDDPSADEAELKRDQEGINRKLGRKDLKAIRLQYRIKGPYSTSEHPDDRGHYLVREGRRAGSNRYGTREEAETAVVEQNEQNRQGGREKKRDGLNRLIETHTGTSSEHETPRTEKSIPKKVKGPLVADEQPDEEGRYAIRESGRYDSSYGSREQAGRVAEITNQVHRQHGRDKKRTAHQRVEEDDKCLHEKVKSIRMKYKGRRAIVGRESDPEAGTRHYLVDKRTGQTIDETSMHSGIRQSEREYDEMPKHRVDRIRRDYREQNKYLDKEVKAKLPRPTPEQLRHVDKDSLHEARSRTVEEHEAEGRRAFEEERDEDVEKHRGHAAERMTMDHDRQRRSEASRHRRNRNKSLDEDTLRETFLQQNKDLEELNKKLEYLT